jgi:hypothetical protein
MEQNRFQFPKKLALSAAVAGGGTFLMMFVLGFLFHIDTIWDGDKHRYIIPALAILLSVCWQFMYRKKRMLHPVTDERIWYTGTVIVRYCIAVILMIYAFAKFTDGQFTQAYADENTTISQASGIKLAWAFFGYSAVYGGFIGGTQIFCALLLFFRRTVMLAIVILLPVLANIFLMDLTHHINAEDIAGCLLYMTVFLFLGQYDRLKAFFITHESIRAYDSKAKWRIGGRARPFVKASVILALTGYAAYENYTEMHEFRTAAPITGSWTAVHEYRGKDTLSEKFRVDTIHTKLYVEDYSYGSMASGNDKTYYELETGTNNRGVIMNFTGKDAKPLRAVYHVFTADSFELAGRQGEDSIRFLFRRNKNQRKK